MVVFESKTNEEHSKEFKDEKKAFKILNGDDPWKDEVLKFIER